MVQTHPAVEEERRAGPGERRRYNRRQPPSVTPPYFETFERIADALEAIAGALTELLPDAGERAPKKKSPAPRTSTEGSSATEERRVGSKADRRTS